MFTRIYSCFLVLMVFGGTLIGAQPARSLREVLSPDAFNQAGLNKLTEEELAFLSVQLFGEANAPQKAPATIIPTLPHGEAAFGQEEKLAVAVTQIQQVPQEIKSRIKGTFTGWSGKTIFLLENGQRWKQVEAGCFDVNLDSPEVTIKKGFLGVFYLRVAGYGSTVKVKRLN